LKLGKLKHMIHFKLNNEEISYQGSQDITLLNYLRDTKGLTSPKDGCSGQAVCGACTVEINGAAKLSCVTKMKSLANAEIYTLEGIPETIRDNIAGALVNQGAVQCGFCTPGFVMRIKVLLQNNPSPSQHEISKAIHPHLCRCTGYKKIIEAIECCSVSGRKNEKININTIPAKVGNSYKKYDAYKLAIGETKFVNDIAIEGLLHAAIKFSDYPRARVVKIDVSKAQKLPGVIRVFTWKDIPGERFNGLIYNDWPLMIAEGEVTRYIGDVIAGVVAENAEIAKKALKLIDIDYDVLKAVSDPFEALKEGSRKVHTDHSNLLDKCKFKRGDVAEAKKSAKYTAKGHFETQRIEHAFLECEAGIAIPDGEDGLFLLSNGQGVYEDRRQVARLLNIAEEKVRVKLIQTGGGFGGKEDMTVQGHVSLFAFLLKKPVKLALSREESIIMHPKRHPVFMDIEIGADENGKLTFLTLRAVGDSGAYASVGNKVMERVAGHAAGGYFVPAVDIEAKTVYTNNIPSGAMRGFGANQVCFALETCIDEICEKANFDRWKFRYDNALVDGLMTATGQKVYQVGIRACLDTLKKKFYESKYSGLACGIKNSGVGNGMPDFSTVRIDIISAKNIVIHHGWTEMGQGIHTMAIQTLCNETGIDSEIISVVVDTETQLKTGMTTSSRATALLGNAIIDACIEFKNDLKTQSLEQLEGKKYLGGFLCDWTTKPGADVPEIITHYSYGYAAQLCVLNDKGEIDTFYAAHDAGKIMNPTLFEGQVEGAVHMGIGYALTEDLPMKEGKLLSTKLKDCQILRASDTPKIVVYGVEVADKVGPYGAKGLGEIGLVPTAAAVANALYQFDKIRRYKLPMKRKSSLL